MKTLKTLSLLCTLAGLLAQAPAQADDSGITDFWVRPAQKTVYFVSKPILNLSLARIGADEQYWDVLEISFSYDKNPAFDAEAAALQKKYPGYQLNTAMVDIGTPLTLSIPVLSRTDVMDVKLSPNGPWFDQTYYITKEQSTALEKAIQEHTTGISVSGQVSVTFPQHQSVERVELGTNVCDEMLEGGNDLYSVMKGYSRVLQTINGMKFKYDDTKTMLEKSVLDSCLELPGPSRSVSSFRDLLETSVSEKAPPTKPAGETDQDIPFNQTIPVKYDVSSSFTGGQP